MKYTQTELDEQLREIALNNWGQFVKLIGLKAVNKAKICMLKQQDRTLKYMSYRTRMPISTVSRHCKVCP